MSDSETKPGPAAPRTEGVDAPTPPGGPQRSDAAPDGLTGADEGVGRQAEDSVEDRHGGTIEEPAPPAAERDPEQEENAETSLDQPSEG